MLIYLQSPHKVSIIESESVSHSVVSNSLQPHRLHPTRLLRPWDSPGQNTEVGCYFFSSGSSQPRDWTRVSCIAGGFFTIWVNCSHFKEQKLCQFRSCVNISKSLKLAQNFNRLNRFMEPCYLNIFIHIVHVLKTQNSLIL